MGFRFPKELELLDFFLLEKGFDTSNLRCDRHVLDILMKKSGIRRRFPPKGGALLPVFRSIHSELFTNVALMTRKRKSKIRGVGTVGPASKVRTVSDDIRAEIERRMNGSDRF